MPDGDELLADMNAENAGDNETAEETVVEEAATEEETAEEETAEEDETGSETTGEEDGEGETEEVTDEEVDLEGDEEPKQAVPVKTWVKQKKKFKEREQALQTEIEELKKAPPAGAGVDSGKFKQYETVLGNFQAGAKQHPAAAMILSAFEKGVEPDWRIVHQTLDAYVKALPAQDPATQAVLRQQQEVLDKLQHDANAQDFERFRGEEDKTIRSEFKEAADDNLFKTVNDVTISLVKAQPEGSFVKPDRVAIARYIHNYGKQVRSGLLKGQKKAGPAKRGAAVPKPKGSGAGKKVNDDWSLKDPTSQEYIEGMQREMARHAATS